MEENRECVPKVMSCASYAVAPKILGGFFRKYPEHLSSMTSRMISDMAGLVQALRDRRDELNVSHETLDAISGLQSGYVSKLLSPRPMKGLGGVSFGALLGALGLAVVVVEDPAAAARVRHLWQPRKRPPRMEKHGALILDRSGLMLASTDGDADVTETATEPEAAA